MNPFILLCARFIIYKIYRLDIVLLSEAVLFFMPIFILHKIENINISIESILYNSLAKIQIGYLLILKKNEIIIYLL